MKILANQLYHIYNQGNNKEVIFRERNDYQHFLQKLREKVLPFCDVVNYYAAKSILENYSLRTAVNESRIKSLSVFELNQTIIKLRKL